MRMRTLALVLAVQATAAAAQTAPADGWRGQSGVMPSYLRPAPKVTQRVSGQSAFNSALARAKGGEVIGLAPGTYEVDISNRAFATPVTITSASPGQPATLRSLRIEEVSNLTITRVVISRNKGSAELTEGRYIGKIGGSRNITLDTVYVHGSLDDDPSNDIIGLNIGGGKNIKLINSEFQQLGRGAQLAALSGAVVANNKVHEMRSDGFNFAQSDHLLIEGNHFSNTKRIKGDHPDAIQFWTLRTKRPSTDIIIRNNQIIQGKGHGTQGIFLKDEMGNMPYERVTIENNLMVGGNMANGIYMLNGKDVNLINNTVVSRSDIKPPVWIRMINVKNLKLDGNIAGAGGNKTPREAKINMKLLDPDNFPTIKAEDMIVPGLGFQLRRSGSGTP